jgi:hypothetical protein
MRKSSILLLLLLLLPMGMVAQDRINLMNGQIVEAKVLGQSSLEVRYQVRKKDRLIERTEPTDGVFSVTDSLGHEKVWYFMDSVFGNELTIPQMRRYLVGERDARAGYRPLVPMLGGFLLGAGAVMALDLEVNSLILPPAYAALMAWPRVNVTRGSIRDPGNEGDPYYAMGYSASARPKRVVRCLLSTTLGVGVGLAIRQLIINPNLDSGF